MLEEGTEDMDEQSFQDRLAELMEKIKRLPDNAGREEAPAADPKGQRDRIQAAIGELQDSLDYLRLSVKYLVFDLEATRRENAYLRRLVEQINTDRSSEQQRDSDNFLDDDQSSAD